MARYDKGSWTNTLTNDKHSQRDEIDLLHLFALTRHHFGFENCHGKSREIG